MKPILVLMAMIFLHVFADYNLQGIMASMKQKSWWRKQYQEIDTCMYATDYRFALAAHAFEWSFVVMIPCAISSWFCEWWLITILYLVLLLSNTALHIYFDDLKANKKRINLGADQVFHILQILTTWAVWTIAIGW